MNDGAYPGSARSTCERTVLTLRAEGEYTLACEALITHYQDAMVSYCTCHLLDPDLAREVAQEIFVAAFEALPRFRGASSVQTWLYGIARKKCQEVQRARRRRTALVRTHQRDIEARVHCDPPARTEELLHQEARRQRVWLALRQLRGDERELLVLRYLEELTYDEIASILHVSRRTVERHLPRAAAKFHTAYERCHAYAVSSHQTTRDSATYAGLVPLLQDVRSS